MATSLRRLNERLWIVEASSTPDGLRLRAQPQQLQSTNYMSLFSYIHPQTDAPSKLVEANTLAPSIARNATTNDPARGTRPQLPPPPRKVVTFDESPSGQTCNQMLTIASGLSKAKAKNWTLLIHGSWSYLIRNNLDVRHIRAWMGESGTIEFVKREPSRDVFRLSSWSDRECAQGLNIDAIREGMRPNKGLREEAETILRSFMLPSLPPSSELSRSRAERESGANARPLRETTTSSTRNEARMDKTTMTPTNATTLVSVSVHLRGFDGMCRERNSDPRRFKWYCHKSLTNLAWGPRFAEEACPYRLDDGFLERFFKETGLSPSETRLAFYVATDGEMDGSSFERFRHPSVASYNWREGKSVGALLRDMWIEALVDYHYGNPQSSCDDVVANWRVGLGRMPFSIFPRKCYDGYWNIAVETPCSHPGMRFIEPT